MPNLDIHKKICEYFLGQPYEDIHIIKDLPAKYLGPMHRILFHDPLFNLLISKGDFKRFLAGCLHDLTDFIDTFHKVFFKSPPEALVLANELKSDVNLIRKYLSSRDLILQKKQ